MGEYKPFGGAFGRLGDDESSGTLLGSPVRKPRFDEGDYVSDDVSSPELMRRLAASQMALEGNDSSASGSATAMAAMAPPITVEDRLAKRILMINPPPSLRACLPIASLAPAGPRQDDTEKETSTLPDSAPLPSSAKQGEEATAAEDATLPDSAPLPSSAKPGEEKAIPQAAASHLDVPPWCASCALMGDDRDERCSMCGVLYLDMATTHALLIDRSEGTAENESKGVGGEEEAAAEEGTEWAGGTEQVRESLEDYCRELELFGSQSQEEPETQPADTDALEAAKREADKPRREYQCVGCQPTPWSPHHTDATFGKGKSKTGEATQEGKHTDATFGKGKSKTGEDGEDGHEGPQQGSGGTKRTGGEAPTNVAKRVAIEPPGEKLTWADRQAMNWPPPVGGLGPGAVYTPDKNPEEVDLKVGSVPTSFTLEDKEWEQKAKDALKIMQKGLEMKMKTLDEIPTAAKEEILNLREAVKNGVKSRSKSYQSFGRWLKWCDKKYQQDCDCTCWRLVTAFHWSSLGFIGISLDFI